MISMRMNGQSKSWMIATPPSFTSAQQQLLCLPTKSWLLAVGPHLKRMPASTSLSRMKSSTNVRWTNPEMLTLLPCAKAISLFLEGFLANRGWIRWRNTLWRRISGLKWRWWKIKDTTWAPARLTTSLSTPLEVSSEVPSKKLTTLLKFMRLRKTHGQSLQFEWR